MRVELVRPNGEREDITFAAGLSLKFGPLPPDIVAVLAEWNRERAVYFDYMSSVFRIPAALLSDDREE